MQNKNVKILSYRSNKLLYIITNRLNFDTKQKWKTIFELFQTQVNQLKIRYTSTQIKSLNTKQKVSSNSFKIFIEPSSNKLAINYTIHPAYEIITQLLKS